MHLARPFLEGVARLPGHLQVDADLLGSQWEVMIGGIPAIIRFPRDRHESTYRPLVRPKFTLLAEDELPRGSLSHATPHPLSEDYDELSWGYINGDAVVVAQLGLVVDELQQELAGLDGIVALLGRQLPQWCASMLEWASIATGQGEFKWIEATESVLLWQSVAEFATWAVEPAIHLTVRQPHFTPLSPKQWASISKLVESDVEFPLDHALMRDAIHAFAKGEYRRAVADAATVVEQTLWVAVNRLHEASSTPFSTYVMTRLGNASFGTLREAAIALKVAVPSRLAASSSLVAMRNNAVHRKALMPTRSEALTMLEVAAELLDTVSPLPGGLETSPRKFGVRPGSSESS